MARSRRKNQIPEALRQLVEEGLPRGYSEYWYGGAGETISPEEVLRHSNRTRRVFLCSPTLRQAAARLAQESLVGTSFSGVDFEDMPTEVRMRYEEEIRQALEGEEHLFLNTAGQICPRRSSLQPNIKQPLGETILTSAGTYRQVTISSTGAGAGDSLVWVNDKGNIVSPSTVQANVDYDPESRYKGLEPPPRESLRPSAHHPPKDLGRIIVGDKIYRRKHRLPAGASTASSFKDLDVYWQSNDGEEVGPHELAQRIEESPNARYVL